MNTNDKKSRIGIQEIITQIRNNPQAERIEDLTNEDIRNTINILLNSIVDSLKDGKSEVIFSGYFTFTTKEVEAEGAKTMNSFGKEIKVDAIPAHRKITVKVSSKLRNKFKGDTSQK
jgi:nucleoid DNA-binding protein